MTNLITTDSKNKSLVTQNATKLPARVATGAMAVVGVGLTAVGVWLWGGILVAIGSIGFLGTWLMKSQPQLPAASSLANDPSIKEVKRVIAKARFLEHIDKEGEKADSLADGMLTRWKTFEKLIVTKFEPNELTFQRYWETAESTFRAHFANLRMVTDQLNQLSLARAEKSKTEPELSQSIAERLDLAERTLSGFDRLATELSKLETSGEQSATYLDDTLKELQELANRAQKYSHSNVRTLE